MLRKARAGLKDNSSTLSVNGTDNSSSSRGGVRSSIDSVHNDGDDSGIGRVSKLIPGRIRKKRRKAREAAEPEPEEVNRGRSIGDRPLDGKIGDNDASEITGEGQSPVDDDGGSSLITYDSDPEP